MFSHKVSEEKPLEIFAMTRFLERKVGELTGLTPQEYYGKFRQAHLEYMGHRTSVFKVRGKFFGPGLVIDMMGTRPYIFNMMARLNQHRLNERDQELLEFLNEDGVGVNKKSLKFHVLARMFDLNPNEFNDKTAAKLINDTQKILLEMYPHLKPETGGRKYVLNIID